MRELMNVSRLLRVSTAVLLLASSSAHAEATGPLVDAIGLTKTWLEERVRYEYVEQAPLAHDANAVTARTRAGFETGKAWDTSLLGELEWVLPISTGYNSTINGKATYPT